MSRQVNFPEVPSGLPGPVADFLQQIAAELDIRAGNVPKAAADAYIAVGDLAPKTITLNANVDSTPMNDARLTVDSMIILTPLTAHAAAELVTLYFTLIQARKCTINHANNAQIDRTFRYTVIG